MAGTKYRTKEAGEVHSAILGYINEQEGFTLEKVKEVLLKYKNNKEALAEKSTHGHSHMIDALHIPYESKVVQANANSLLTPSEKSLLLFETILENIDDPDIVYFLLSAQDNMGFDPISVVLKYGEMPNVNAFFSHLKRVLTNGSISPKAYQDILCRVNMAGFTALNAASTSADKIAVYMDALLYGLELGSITADDFIKFLTTSDPKVFYFPIQSVMQCGNGLKIFLNKLFEAANKHLITPGQCTRALKSKLRNGAKLLTTMMTDPKLNSSDFEMYLNCLDEFKQANLISQQDYLDILCDCKDLNSMNDSDKFTLHAILKSNPICQGKYFSLVRQLVANQELTYDEFMKLVSKDIGKKNMLHAAACISEEQLNSAIQFINLTLPRMYHNTIFLKMLNGYQHWAVSDEAKKVLNSLNEQYAPKPKVTESLNTVFQSLTVSQTQDKASHTMPPVEAVAVAPTHEPNKFSLSDFIKVKVKHPRGSKSKRQTDNTETAVTQEKEKTPHKHKFR